MHPASPWLTLVLAATTVLFAACGDDDEGVGPSSDLEPPTAIADLAVTMADSASLTLTWTATGDDQLEGPASVYDIRYTTDPRLGWNLMTPVDGEPTPSAPGATDAFTVQGLSPNVPYTFRMKVGDEVPNWSDQSNTANGTTTLLMAPRFAVIPAGTFVMGDGVSDCAHEERRVTLTHDFLLGQTEVTTEQYLKALNWAYKNGLVAVDLTSIRDLLDNSTKAVVNLNDPECEIQFLGDRFDLRDGGHGINPTHPMKFVTWYGAAAYCDWLSLMEGLPRAYDHSTWQCNGGAPYEAPGYRLPTDAEWEYAASNGDDRLYPWGNDSPNCSRANCDYNCVGWTSAVGSYPAAPFVAGRELFDMTGNVLEWCNDWYTCHLGTADVTDPVGPASGNSRVARGSSWDYGSVYARCADRAFGSAYGGSGSNNIGFRVARSVIP
jgi:formylglycine-generating enzyme required for sulfatase activity